MYKIALTLLIFLLVPALDSLASDQTIKVIPGGYDLTTKTTSSFNPNETVSNEQLCIDKTAVGVEDFMPDKDSCSASNVKKSGNKLSFDMKCSGTDAMPTMTGTAEVSASGKNVQSKYKMVGSYQGQDFSVTTNSTGKNTGPCK